LKLSTDGLRSEVEGRVTDFIAKNGGLQALVSAGRLTDKKSLALLGLTAGSVSVPTVAVKENTPEKAVKRCAARSLPILISEHSKNSVAASDVVEEVEKAWEPHSPTKLVSFVQEHAHASYGRIFTDLRAKLSSPVRLWIAKCADINRGIGSNRIGADLR
jgi:hypothetical protein